MNNIGHPSVYPFVIPNESLLFATCCGYTNTKILSALQMPMGKWRDRSKNDGNWAMINTVGTGAELSRSIAQEGGASCGGDLRL